MHLTHAWEGCLLGGFSAHESRWSELEASIVERAKEMNTPAHEREEPVEYEPARNECKHPFPKSREAPADRGQECVEVWCEDCYVVTYTDLRALYNTPALSIDTLCRRLIHQEVERYEKRGRHDYGSK